MVLDGGDLDLGSGLLLLLEQALDPLEPGAELVVRSTERTVAHDLPAWCRVTGHRFLGAERDGGAALYRLERGAARRLNLVRRPEWGARAPLRRGELDTRDWRVGLAGEIPARADSATGFSPRGAAVERGAPDFGFAIVERDRVWADEAAELYEQATASQWDASRDLPWAELAPLPGELERAVCQVMTFLAENELSALYVPGKFLPRIHPHFTEVVLFLATQLADEARHVEAFQKRALANGGGLQGSTADSMRSLKTLLDQEDFTSASFLLSVLGEGTFLDLLRFVEEHAPDPVTREVAKRARVDEARHVRFGVAHVRYFLDGGAGRAEELAAAARARAGALSGAAPSPLVMDALAVLAAGSLAPARVRSGVAAARDLQATMHENRVRRLASAGFPPALCEELSTLHTPNFM